MNLEILNKLNEAVLGDELHEKSKDEHYIQQIHEAAQKKPIHIYHGHLRHKGNMIQDSFENYLSSPYVSSSILKAAYKSPLHLKSYLERENNDTSSFQLGRLVHACLLEPTRFNRLAVEPAGDLRKADEVENKLLAMVGIWEKAASQKFPDPIPDQLKARKELIKDIRTRPEVDFITAQELEVIHQIRHNVDNYGGGIISRLFYHSKREISFYLDGETPQRVRPDAIAFEENIGVNAIISIKTTSRDSLESFYRDAIYKYHYDLSEAMYQEIVTQCSGRKFDTTITVMLQTVEPYLVGVVLSSDESGYIKRGKEKYIQALESYRESTSSGVYPGLDRLSEYSGLITWE